MSLRDAAQELIELGVSGTMFRVRWELHGRAQAAMPRVFGVRPIEITPERASPDNDWTARLPMEDPVTAARALDSCVPVANRRRLLETAERAASGRLLCFGRWEADYGSPVNWFRDPVTGRTWSATAVGPKAFEEHGDTDVKLVWEIGRFPQAYLFARAAAFEPALVDRYAQVMFEQIADFSAKNAPGCGIHWASGQEIAFRMLAWSFALRTLMMRSKAGDAAAELVRQHLLAGAHHIEAHLDYARLAVYNNHLLSEAVGLLAAGVLLPDHPDSARWRRVARQTLDEQADRQFYKDGGYIQQSHNYHRVALQMYMWASAFARADGQGLPPGWAAAMGRSIDLLIAHQNQADGRLPNYGPNDGALPAITSTCDFSDMRPLIQAVSILARGHRVYPPGPWDESAVWFLGARALDAPLHTPLRRSVSFAETGYHVLRGRDESAFGAFRCGSLHDRFSQIDMLHLDVWWRGHNVLVDPGSFQYNGAPKWHDHFMRTASHNTVVVDGRDQMLHYRQFKLLYLTRAQLLRFAEDDGWAVMEGEHYGYRRYDGRCVHRRAVLFLKDDVWIVVDTVLGSGRHSARLHWLGGQFPWVPATNNGFDSITPSGIFTVRTFDAVGAPLTGDVVSGSEEPPRGWLSRYYAEKVAVPSFAATIDEAVPVTAISVLAGAKYELSVSAGTWTIATANGNASFRLDDGRFATVDLQS